MRRRRPIRTSRPRASRRGPPSSRPGPTLFEKLRGALNKRAEALRELELAQSETLVAHIKTLAIHRQRNLFIRSTDRLDWDKTEAAISDLGGLPAWMNRTASRIGAYFSDPDHRAGVLSWAGTVVLLIATVWVFGRGMRRRSIAMEAKRAQAETEERATLHAAYRFGRRGLHLLLIYGVPWSAAMMLPELSTPVEELLLHLAGFFTMAYLIWSVYRELLRPNAPEQAILDVEPPVRRQLSLAIILLLTMSACARIPTFALRAEGYANETAFLLLELLLLLGLTLSLSGLVFRKPVFHAILPQGDAAWARAARGFGRMAAAVPAPCCCLWSSCSRCCASKCSSSSSRTTC